MTASIHPLGKGASAGNYYTNDPHRETQNRDDYYALDGGGVWWSSASSVVQHGASIDLKSFRDLCAGFHPATGVRLVRGAGDDHRAGWDITFSAPKTFSILWASGDDEQRSKLEAIQTAAVDEALRLLADERIVEVRLGAGGRDHEPATDLIIGRFAHYTSRAGDPNCHVHCVLMNTGACSDGFFRTLEPRRVYDWLHTVGAAYRAALSARLHHEFGFAPRGAGRGQFEIRGVPDALIEAFSKRSRDLEAKLGRDRSAASSAQKELAALATRGAKEDLPTGPALEARWREELDAIGVDPWMAAREGERTPVRDPERGPEQALDPPEIGGTSPVALAATALFRHENVLDRRSLLERGLMEAALQSATIQAVRDEIAPLEQSGALIRLPGPADDPHWTTPGLAQAEAALLRAADRTNERAWFTPEAIRDALAQASHLSDEQRAAVEQAASRDGVSVIEAGAGTGKTTLARALVDAAERSGLTVVGMAPSWVAADELSRSTGIAAQAIAKWRHDRSTGHAIAYGASHLIIVDEAGMAGTRDLAAVLTSAAQSGSKVIVMGDRAQLASVAGASALRTVVEVVGRHATLAQVRRQEIEWQRAASTLMARGDVEAGLRAYGQRGRIDLVAGPEAAQARVIDLWREARLDHGDHEVLILTRHNRDAAALNRAARDVLRAEGLLRGDDVLIPSLDRAKKKQPLALAPGDRVRFGETLPHYGIRNGTRAVVENITVDTDRATLRVRLDDGRVVDSALDSFTRRLPGRANAELPRLTHAYAGTVYSVQGRTAAAAVMYLAVPTDAREIYVGMTRHTRSATIVADRDRIEAACRSAANPATRPSAADLHERLFAEARRYSEKRTVADFVDDRAEFARTGVIPPPFLDRRINLRRAFDAGRLLRAALQELTKAPRLMLAHYRALIDRSERRMSATIARTVDSIRNERGNRTFGRHRDGTDRGPDLSR